MQCRYDDAGGLTPVTEEDAAMSPPVSAELLSVFLKIAIDVFPIGCLSLLRPRFLMRASEGLLLRPPPWPLYPTRFLARNPARRCVASPWPAPHTAIMTDFPVEVSDWTVIYVGHKACLGGL